MHIYIYIIRQVALRGMSASTNWFEARTPFSKKSIKPVQLCGKGVRNGWPSLHLTTTHSTTHPRFTATLMDKELSIGVT